MTVSKTTNPIKKLTKRERRVLIVALIIVPSSDSRADGYSPDERRQSPTFKIDTNGNAVPKEPYQVDNPYPKGTNQQHDRFLISGLVTGAK